ncbi:MAG: DUF4886 domain-containing protein [Clostridia bacterium]|nr:DUF4886 domain-containing protein [Clostridia bacterium]
MTIRKITALVLAVLLSVALTACGNGTTQEPAADADVSTTTADTTEDVAESTTEGATEDTTESVPQETSTTAPADKTTSRPVMKETSKKETTTTTSGKKVVTFTTAEITTTTTKDKTKGKSIKILAIGNSFSVDAMNNHLYDVFAEAGYTDITLGNLYIGGCSLDMHYDNLKSNKAAYTFYLNTDGQWSQQANATAGTAFGKARWDVVTIQQVSSQSGLPKQYGNLQGALELIKQKEPQAKIYWHMTWAYQQDSKHEAFPHYKKDQMTMYKAIVNTVQEKVATNSLVDGIIPAGTAIQNLRTSELGDTLTSDGHHLKDTYGDYTAALTWFCTITGEKPEATAYRPVNSFWSAVSQSVSAAIAKPYQVTNCK